MAQGKMHVLHETAHCLHPGESIAKYSGQKIKISPIQAGKIVVVITRFTTVITNVGFIDRNSDQ